MRSPLVSTPVLFVIFCLTPPASLCHKMYSYDRDAIRAFSGHGSTRTTMSLPASARGFMTIWYVPGGAPLVVAAVPVPVWVGLRMSVSAAKVTVATQPSRFAAVPSSGMAAAAPLTSPDPTGSARAVLERAATKRCSTAVDMVLCTDTIVPLFCIWDAMVQSDFLRDQPWHAFRCFPTHETRMYHAGHHNLLTTFSY